MRKKSSISTLLGIRQQDIATLLGVTRSQWAMFDTGKRDLPLSAQQLLADMLVYINTSEAAAKSRSQDERHDAERKQLEYLLRENEYRQMQTTRKITIATKKLQAQQRQLLLADFLNACHQDAIKADAGIVMHLTRSSSGSFGDKGYEDLFALRLNLEVLEMEKVLLEEKLGKDDSKK